MFFFFSRPQKMNDEMTNRIFLRATTENYLGLSHEGFISGSLIRLLAFKVGATDLGSNTAFFLF